MLRVGRHDEGNLRDQADEGEVADRIVRHLLLHGGGGGMSAGQHEQGITVGRRPGDETGRNPPARSRLRLDDDRLPKAL
jgi:hypothetical protein